MSDDVRTLSPLRRPSPAIACGLIAFCTVFGGAAPGAIQPDQAPTLAADTRLERDLNAGGTDRYGVPLDARQFFHAVVSPRGIDVAVSVRHPDGRPLMNLDYAADAATAETIMFVADAPGRYEIDVRPARDGVPAGRYVIRVAALRSATEADRRRVDARRKLESSIRNRAALELSAWSQVLEQFEAARHAAHDATDRETEAHALFELAFTAYSLGRPEARERAQEALASSRELGDRALVARALDLMGGVHDRAGELPEGREVLLQSLALCRELGNGMLEATVENGIGITYGRNGEPERALEHFERALRASRTMKVSRLAVNALNNLGIATKDLGDYRLSLSYYEQSLAGARTLADRTLEANVLNNLGALYRVLQDYEKALAAHSQALALAREVANPTHEARALNHLGFTNYRLGHYEKALEYHEQSLAIRRRIDDHPAAVAATLGGIGRASHRLGDRDKALDRLSEALRLARAAGERQTESDTLRDLAQVERDRGNLTAALDHITAAVELTDSMRARVFSPDLRASFVASEQEQYEVHIGVLMQLHRAQPGAGYDRRALAASERGRARVLVESLLEARTDIRRGIDPALFERERAASRALDRAYEGLSRSMRRRSDPEAADRARAAIETATAEYRHLQARIRQESPAYAALVQPRPLTTGEIQREVAGPDTLLLEFALGEERSWLWAISQTAVASFELPARRDIDAAARGIHALVTARQPRPGESPADRAPRVRAADAEWRARSTDAARMLFGAVAAHMGRAWRGKRLLIVASDSLAYVPFAALPDPSGDGEPLLTSHEIVSLPSASVLAVIRDESAGREPAAKTLAVLADPVFEASDPRVVARDARTSKRSIARTAAVRREAPATFVARVVRSVDSAGARLSRLPFSREEARAIAAFVPAAERREAIDFDANRTTVMNGEFAPYRLVHFATHGILNTEQPELSGLVLSLVDRDGRTQDGFLRLNDIYNLRLPAEVVVLSACQTALGKEIRGEGLVGLTRGFMYAGARRVVASLWQVDDLATAELMRRFYRGMLKDRLRPAAALRAAQRELARDPRWASPFFWSAFVLQGEWR